MAKRRKLKATPRKARAGTKKRASKKNAGAKKRIAKATLADAVVGACMVPDNAGGPTLCQQLDEATCAKRGGVFLGGPC